MSTKSQEVGKAVLNGIDALEAGAHDTVHSGAVGARRVTKASSRWAARQEASAMRKARLVKGDLKKQASQLQSSAYDKVEMAGDKARQVASNTHQYVKNKPWTAVAIASGIGVLLGALLGRRS